MKVDIRRVGAVMVASAAAAALGAFALLRIPWFLRWRGTEYLSAMGALATVAAAVFTLGAAIFAAVYVLLTYLLWRDSAKQREADLMLKLMHGYDDLRDSILFIQDWYIECAASGPTAPVERFSSEFVNADNPEYRPFQLDQHRFRVSRFFVSIRKLVKGGYLPEDLVVHALGVSQMKVFLDLVDPLDAAAAGSHYSDVDRQFFLGLIAKVGEERRSTDATIQSNRC